MTVYDDMRGYIHAHDRNGWFDVTTETTPMYQMVDKADAENAKLRDELANAPKCEACEAMLDCDECLRADGSHKERRRLSAENAKLRKLAQRMWRLERFGCYGCRQECDAESCYANDCKEAIEIEQEMHELGVEVDG